MSNALMHHLFASDNNICLCPPKSGCCCCSLEHLNTDASEGSDFFLLYFWRLCSNVLLQLCVVLHKHPASTCRLRGYASLGGKLLSSLPSTCCAELCVSPVQTISTHTCIFCTHISWMWPSCSQLILPVEAWKWKKEEFITWWWNNRIYILGV